MPKVMKLSVIAGVVLISGALTACGVRGPLDKPKSVAEAPADPSATGEATPDQRRSDGFVLDRLLQ